MIMVFWLPARVSADLFFLVTHACGA